MNNKIAMALVYIPRYAVKVDRHQRVYGAFVKALGFRIPPDEFAGGRRRLIVKLAMPMLKMRMKAIARIVHGNLPGIFV